MKALGWVGAFLGLCVAMYLVFHYSQYFSDVSFLGGFLLLELLVASLWKFKQRFFILLIIAFVWASMTLPLKGNWQVARWVVLAAGATSGFLVWTTTSTSTSTSRRSFGSLHLIAFFCVSAAFVSASVSPFVQMASLKALSLLLLFLYCATGGRLAVLGREDRFFSGLLLGCEIAVYFSAICYFALDAEVWGNPNSLGAAMSIGVFPILLWAWLAEDQATVKLRRLVALLVCTYLIFYSGARAAIVSMVVVTLVLCFCLRQYKLLLKVVALALFLIGINGMIAPENLNQRLEGIKDAALYKGHKQAGLLGSRRTPWETTIASIKEHPLFGTGYGTSPTGEDPGLYFGVVASSAETAREHGSSYMTIAEWVGLLGLLPFVALLAMTVSNVWKVCRWMSRILESRHYSIPVAMVVLSGLVHASFEDWLFAVGSYPCVYFWFFAFLLGDLVPETVEAPLPGIASRPSRPLPAAFGTIAPY
jgi:O-antigen ligase